MLKSVPQEKKQQMNFQLRRTRIRQALSMLAVDILKKCIDLMIQLKKANISQQQHYPTNPHYNMKWCNNFFLKYFSVLPLWSSSMSCKKKSFSNAIVENNFCHIKHDIFGDAANLKVQQGEGNIERVMWGRSKKQTGYLSRKQYLICLFEKCSHDIEPKNFIVETWPDCLPKDDLF